MCTTHPHRLYDKVMDDGSLYKFSGFDPEFVKGKLDLGSCMFAVPAVFTWALTRGLYGPSYDGSRVGRGIVFMNYLSWVVSRDKPWGDQLFAQTQVLAQAGIADHVWRRQISKRSEMTESKSFNFFFKKKKTSFYHFFLL